MKNSGKYNIAKPICVSLILILLAFFPTASFATNQYIKEPDKGVPINWDEDSCELNLLVDKNTNHNIGYQCKIETDNANNITTTWLKDSKGKLLYIPNFLLTNIIFIDPGYGLELYSDNDAVRLFLEIDKNGSFQESHVVDGEILLNDGQYGLLYPGTLVWRSTPLGKNKCVSDFESKLGRKPNELDSLYLHVPALINVRPLSFFYLSDNEKTTLIQNIMNETLQSLIPYFDTEANSLSRDDYKERVFVFLATNSANSKALNTMIDNYKELIGTSVLNTYKITESCLNF